MSKRVLLAGLAALLGCGAPSAATKPSDDASPNSSSLVSDEWRELQAAYAGQQESLQQELGDGVFVASYRGWVHDGQLITFATWTDSVTTALPKTQFVWLQDAKMTRWFVVSWSDLEAAIGVLPALEGTDPPRYLTPAAIPASYFSKLEQTFVPPQGFPERVATGRR